MEENNGDVLLMDLYSRQGMGNCKAQRHHVCCAAVQDDARRLQAEYRRLATDMRRLRQRFHDLKCAELAHKLTANATASAPSNSAQKYNRGMATTTTPTATTPRSNRGSNNNTKNKTRNNKKLVNDK